jgi:hypothetical protein
MDLNAVADTVLLRILETRFSPQLGGTDWVKPDGMLYDFPVRLSITVRDSVLVFEVAGCPMVVAWVRVEVEHE